MRKTIVTIAIVFGCLATLACLGAMQGAQGPSVDTLVRQIGDLSLRVARLEHADGATPGAVDSTHKSSTKTVARSMIFGGMTTFDNQPADPDQIANLQQEADSLQSTSDYHQDQQAQVAGDMYNTSAYYSDDSYGYRHTNAGRERAEMAQNQMANRYATEASNKRMKIKELQDAANEPRQLIHGHDGDIVFTLRTMHDLSGSMSVVNIGDTVTWEGRRVSADDTSETWEITAIRKVDTK